MFYFPGHMRSGLKVNQNKSFYSRVLLLYCQSDETKPTYYQQDVYSLNDNRQRDRGRRGSGQRYDLSGPVLIRVESIYVRPTQVHFCVLILTMLSLVNRNPSLRTFSSLYFLGALRQVILFLFIFTSLC